MRRSADPVTDVELHTPRPPVPVSVVVPFHDGQTFARESLGSVLSQTRPPREILIVDDGSGPGGRSFLSEWLDEYADAPLGPSSEASFRPRGAARLRSAQHRVRLRLIRLSHRSGPGRARNVGIEFSSQPLIAFQDSDDLWELDKLERQVGLLDAWPELDGCCTDAVLFTEWGAEQRTYAPQRAVTPDDVLRGTPIATPSLVLRREALDRLGGFDEGLRCSQDWDLQIRLVLARSRLERLPDPLVRVRRGGHGHHSANWRCFLVGHLRVVWRHRAAYLERGGAGALFHQVLRELRTAGLKRGGALGALLQWPSRAFAGAS